MLPNFAQQKTDKADLLEKIRPDSIVNVIKMNLQGYEWDPKSDEWKINKALQKLALTEVGASSIANLMLPASSQNVSLSNLKDLEIKKRVKAICRTAIYMAVTNWRDYGVYNPAQLRFINEVVFTNSFVVLKQPENEGIRRLIGHSVSEQRSTQTYNEGTGRGLFNIFGGRKK